MRSHVGAPRRQASKQASKRHASKYESSNKYLTTCTLCFRRKNSAREPGRDSLRGRVVFPWVFTKSFFGPSPVFHEREKRVEIRYVESRE